MKPLMRRHPILDTPAPTPALLSVGSGSSGRENKSPQTAAPRWLVGTLTHYIEAKWHANVRIAFRRWKYQAKYAFSLKFAVPIQHNTRSNCLDRANQLFPHSQTMLTRHAWRQCGAQKILLMLDQRFLAMVGTYFQQWRQHTRELTHSMRRYLFKWSDFTYLRKIARLSAERFIFLTVPLVRAFIRRLKALAMAKFKSNLRWYKATIHMRFAFRSWKAHTREFRALRQLHCKPVIVAWGHQARLERHALQHRAALAATSAIRRPFRKWKRRTLKIQHILLWAAMRPRSPKLQLIRAWRTWLHRIRSTVMRSRSPNRHRPYTSASVMSLSSPRGRESPSFFRGSRSSSASFSSFSHGRALKSQPPFRTGLSPSHLHSRRSGDTLASSASSTANSSLASFDRKLWLDVTRGKYQSRTASSPVGEDRIMNSGGNSSSPYQQRNRQTQRQRSQHQVTIATARIVKPPIVSIQPAPSPFSRRYLTEESDSDVSTAALATDADLAWEMNSYENQPPQQASSSESGLNRRNDRYHGNRQITSPSVPLCITPSSDVVCSVGDWFKQSPKFATAVAVTNDDCDDIADDCGASSSFPSEQLQLKLQELELSVTADVPLQLQLPIVLKPYDSEQTQAAELGLDINVDTSPSSTGAPIAEVGGNSCEPPPLHENTQVIETTATNSVAISGEELVLALKIEQPHQLERLDHPDTVTYTTSAVATEAAEIAAIERKAKRYLKASQSASKTNVPKLTAQEKLKWRLYRAKQLSASIDQQTAVDSHSRAKATKASERKR